MKPADEAKPQAEYPDDEQDGVTRGELSDDYEVSARDMVLFVDGKQVKWDK